jgi:hypothetical protein
MASIIQAETLAAQTSQEELPLRLSEPVEAIIADLEPYIPRYMSGQNLPGVGIAQIRYREVV